MSFSRNHKIPIIDTKLHEAAVEGRFEEFERYADSLDLLVNSKQDTILHIHLNTIDHTKSTEFVHKALERCPQLLMQTNEDGDTPLHVAARSGYSEMARLLIQLAKSGDIESGEEARKIIRMVNKDKDTALHEAARWDHYGVVEEILAAEDLEYKYGVNDSRETPLYLAACCRSVNSLFAMLEAYKHKPVAYRGPNGKTVLIAAIVHGLDTKIIENLGSLVNEADENGWTPLHYAVCFPDASDVVSKILEKDTSSAYMKDHDRKRTPLHLAACLGNTVAMKLIISKCRDCAELTDSRGWNVCHFVSISKSTEAQKLLLHDHLLAHLKRRRDINGYLPYELYFFSNYGRIWDNDRFIYDSIRNKSPDEISKKKEEIGKWTKELGDGPFGKIIAGALVEKSPEEIRKEVEEEIIPELEKAKDSHLVAAVLVATVTFAAAFTLPGGYVSDEDNSNNMKLGSPILSRNAAFKAFVITDGIAMLLSMSSVFIHFLMVMLGYKQKYYWLMRSAFWNIVIAMGAMVIAFITGTYAVLAPNSSGLALLICLIGISFFVYVFYTVIRLIYGILRDTSSYNILNLGPQYLCWDCSMLWIGCYWLSWLICFPIFVPAYLINYLILRSQMM